MSLALKNKYQNLPRFENVQQFWIGAHFTTTGWKWTVDRQLFSGKVTFLNHYSITLTIIITITPQSTPNGNWEQKISDALPPIVLQIMA